MTAAHDDAQTDLEEVEGWGSVLARPRSSAGPPCASSSGAASSSSSSCLARLLWLSVQKRLIKEMLTRICDKKNNNIFLSKPRIIKALSSLE